MLSSVCGQMLAKQGMTFNSIPLLNPLLNEIPLHCSADLAKKTYINMRSIRVLLPLLRNTTPKDASYSWSTLVQSNEKRDIICIGQLLLIQYLKFLATPLKVLSHYQEKRFFAKTLSFFGLLWTQFF